jgi:hypothetical protein
MEEIVVTRLWMAGVVGAMVVFGIIALIGYHRQNANTDSNDPEN